MFAGPTSAAAPASQTWSKGHSFSHCGLVVVDVPASLKLTDVFDGRNGPEPSR
jgi:hypothetical protein